MRTVMEETVMNGPSDAGSIPASSITCTKEGPTKWEDALVPTQSHPNRVRIFMLCFLTCTKEGPTKWEDAFLLVSIVY